MRAPLEDVVVLEIDNWMAAPARVPYSLTWAQQS